MLDSSIDCKQDDCPYYGYYAGDSSDNFYINHGCPDFGLLSKTRKREIDNIIRATCNMCIYNPQERLDMKEWVIIQDAKRLLKK